VYYLQMHPESRESWQFDMIAIERKSGTSPKSYTLKMSSLDPSPFPYPLNCHRRPTAVGKTEISIQLAERLGGEIVRRIRGCSTAVWISALPSQHWKNVGVSRTI